MNARFGTPVVSVRRSSSDEETEQIKKSTGDPVETVQGSVYNQNKQKRGWDPLGVDLQNIKTTKQKNLTNGKAESFRKSTNKKKSTNERGGYFQRLFRCFVNPTPVIL